LLFKDGFPNKETDFKSFGLKERIRNVKFLRIKLGECYARYE